MTNQQHITPIQIDYSIPGFQVLSYGPAGEWALVVRAEKHQADWHPFEKAEGLKLDTLGSTVFYRGEHYHLVEEQQTSMGWVYRLESWPLGEVMNDVIDLSPAYVADIKNQMLEFEKVRSRMQIGAFYEVIFGWLPARWQEAIADSVYISPNDASRKNAILQAAVSPLITMLALFEIITNNDFDRVLIYVVTIAGLSFVEGCIRLAHCIASNQAIGLFIPGAIDWFSRHILRR